jgi:hypothetical protein
MLHPRTFLLGLAAVGGCSELPARDRSTSVHELTITSVDFSFASPDTVPAGLTCVRLSNNGREHHHAQIARLHPGALGRPTERHPGERGPASLGHLVGGPGAGAGTPQ